MQLLLAPRGRRPHRLPRRLNEGSNRIQPRCRGTQARPPDPRATARRIGGLFFPFGFRASGPSRHGQDSHVAPSSSRFRPRPARHRRPCRAAGGREGRADARLHQADRHGAAGDRQGEGLLRGRGAQRHARAAGQLEGAARRRDPAASSTARTCWRASRSRAAIGSAPRCRSSPRSRSTSTARPSPSRTAVYEVIEPNLPKGPDGKVAAPDLGRGAEAGGRGGRGRRASRSRWAWCSRSRPTTTCCATGSRPAASTPASTCRATPRARPAPKSSSRSRRRRRCRRRSRPARSTATRSASRGTRPRWPRASACRSSSIPTSAGLTGDKVFGLTEEFVAAEPEHHARRCRALIRAVDVARRR